MLTASKILDMVRKEKLVKSEAVSLLKVLIENSKGTKKRVESLKILEEISPKDLKTFKFLENLFLSDWSPFVRHTALRILIRIFPNKSIPALEWVVNSKNWLPSIILKTILDELEISENKNLSEIRKSFAEILEERYELKYIDAKPLLDLHYQLEHNSEEKLEENPTFITAPTENGRLIGLGLSCQDLEDVPSIIRSFSNLKDLDLSENNLTSLPDWICQFKYLECLSIGGNSFISLPNCLLNHNALNYLEFYSRSLEINTIPEVVVEFATQKAAKKYIRLGIVLEDAQVLGMLDALSSGSLGKVSILKRPENSYSGCSLFKTNKNGRVVGLYIIGGEVDHIKIIPDQIGNLTCLKELNLSFNQIQILPESIGKLKSLKRLNLSYNLIREVPESLYNLFSLKVLDLSHNKLSGKYIKKIEKRIKQTVDNHEIRMAEKQKIEIELFRGAVIAKSDVKILKNIEKITGKKFVLSYELWTNRMSFIVDNLRVTGICLFDSVVPFPNSILQLKFLKKLYLIAMGLTTFPEDIDKLVHLKKLSLRANLLKTLPISIGNLPSLKELDLSENNLSELPRSICNLKSLLVLHIDHDLYLKFYKTLIVLEEGGVKISK